MRFLTLSKCLTSVPCSCLLDHFHSCYGDQQSQTQANFCTIFDEKNYRYFFFQNRERTFKGTNLINLLISTSMGTNSFDGKNDLNI